MLICTGLILATTRFVRKDRNSRNSIGLLTALAVGAAQGMAIIPGISRSGTTIVCGILCKTDRELAARFSFLLSVPAIAMAAGYEMTRLIEVAEPVAWTDMLAGVVVSGVSAYFCIHYFLKLLDRIGMMPFVAYRLILGIVLFAMFL